MLNLTINKQFAESHFNLIKGSINRRIHAILADGGISYNNNIVPLPETIIPLLNIFLVEDQLREVILCEPDNLAYLIGQLRLMCPASTNSLEPEYKILYRIFYDHGYSEIDNDSFIKSHNIDTCPYCNRGYIYVLDKEGKVKPEIDHFYPTGIYPFFAASFYNLIPSCETCNGFSAKGKIDPLKEDIVNPYLISSTDFEFDYQLHFLSLINPTSGKSTVDVIFKHKIDSHLKTFKLDKLYAKHSDHVLELIVKSQMKYSHLYREYLKSYIGLGLSDNEIDRLIVGSYVDEKDIHKRPLSKMYRDIALKLGLIDRS